MLCGDTTIVDNYGTHKTPLIHRWLLRHPRFHLHFTPMYSSWINQVERWFAQLTENKSAAGATAAHAHWRTPSASTWPITMSIRSRSSGSRQRTRSSTASLDLHYELLGQDTSGSCRNGLVLEECSRTTEITLFGSEATLFAFASPHERSGVGVPASHGVLQPGDQLRHTLRMLPSQGSPANDALDGLRHIQPRSAKSV